MKSCIRFSFGLILLFTAAWSHAEPVPVATFNYPPMMSETPIEGLGNGLFLDLNQEIFKNADLSADISVLPVRRALIKFKEEKFPFYLGSAGMLKNVGIKDDEADMILLGYYQIDFHYLKSRNPSPITYAKLEELKPYRIGVIAGSELIQPFTEAGLNIDPVREIEINLKKLFAERIDLWAAESMSAKYVIAKLFPDRMDDVTVVKPPIFRGKAVLAWLKSSPNAVGTGAVLRETFEKMKKDDSYMNLLKTYWKGVPPPIFLPDDMQ